MPSPIFTIKNPIMIADEESFNDALKMLTHNELIMNADAREQFVANNIEDFEMQPLHSDDNPILVDAHTQAQIWCDPEDPQNPALMVSILYKVDVNSEGKIDRDLCGVVAGEEFQGVVLYRRDTGAAGGCCPRVEAAFSALVFIENGGTIGWTQRDTVLTKDSCQGVFRKAPEGILRSTHEMAHVYAHAKSEGPCGHSHDKLPTAIGEKNLG